MRRKGAGASNRATGKDTEEHGDDGGKQTKLAKAKAKRDPIAPESVQANENSPVSAARHICVVEAARLLKNFATREGFKATSSAKLSGLSEKLRRLTATDKVHTLTCAELHVNGDQHKDVIDEALQAAFSLIARLQIASDLVACLAETHGPKASAAYVNLIIDNAKGAELVCPPHFELNKPLTSSPL